MKLKTLFSALALFLMVGTLSAQDRTTSKVEQTSPEHRAMLHTRKMSAKLNFTPEQLNSVGELNKTYAIKEDEAIKNGSTKEDFRKTHMAKYDSELKPLLTDDQWKLYLAFKEEQKGSLDSKSVKSTR